MAFWTLVGRTVGPKSGLTPPKLTTPWHDPWNGVFKLRKRIPARYREVAGVPGGTLKMSTGTADVSELKRRWPTVLQRSAALEAGWARKLAQVVLTA